MITVQSSTNENTLGCWESGWLFFFFLKKNPLYLQNFKKLLTSRVTSLLHRTSSKPNKSEGRLTIEKRDSIKQTKPKLNRRSADLRNSLLGSQYVKVIEPTHIFWTQPDPEQAPIELCGMRTRRISLGKYEEANKGGYIPHKQYVMIPMVNQVYIKLFISRQVQGLTRFVR